MYNSDYIPLDPKNVLQEEMKSAGGNRDIMVFHDARKFRRIIKALEELRIFWCEVEGEILVSRHEVYDVINFMENRE